MTLLSAEPITREEYCRENYSEDYKVSAAQGEQPRNSMLTKYKHHRGPHREGVTVKQASRHSIRLTAIMKWTMYKVCLYPGFKAWSFPRDPHNERRSGNIERDLQFLIGGER